VRGNKGKKIGGGVDVGREDKGRRQRGGGLEGLPSDYSKNGPYKKWGGGVGGNPAKKRKKVPPMR